MIVLFEPLFPLQFFLLGLSYERVIEQIRPGEPLGGRLVEQALQEALELDAHVVGVLDGVLDDQLDEGIDAVGVEGRLSDEKLVQNHAQGPKVDRVVVGQLLHQFRGHVERRAFALKIRSKPLMEVKTTVLEDMALAKPKSHNFTTPLALMRMF